MTTDTTLDNKVNNTFSNENIFIQQWFVFSEY